MNIYYEGKDITNSVHILKCIVFDNCGGIADTMELVFSDTLDMWSKWKPKKNDTIEIKESNFSSGIMYIDTIQQRRGQLIIKALSIPLDSKTTRNRAWENVRFLEFSNEIANQYGFSLESYDITNFLYKRVDQIQQTDFEFLAYRCMLEGYVLKINNKKVIIYNEQFMEQQKEAATLYKNQIEMDYNFKSISTGIYKGCQVSSCSSAGLIKGEFILRLKDYASLLKKNIYVATQGEAYRYAKNILRYFNKDEIKGSFSSSLRTDICAGNVINIKNIGLFDNKYFINQVAFDLVNKKSLYQVRGVMEGY